MPDLIVHGHIYQPLREDPFEGKIPIEETAQPYHDWDEKAVEFCYGPLAMERVFEAGMSFNIGPTLALECLLPNHQEIWKSIVAQENHNYRKHGVGNGIAQGFNHTILALSTLDDIVTQVRWGIYQFEREFKHRTSGFWLSETAVNENVLLVLAQNDISFTILAPWQAKNTDTSMPARISADGRDMAIFFYEDPLSGRLSFDPTISENADQFIQNEVLKLFSENKQLVMISTDGEFYGLHQPYRTKFAAHLLNGASHSRGINITYPGQWLMQHSIEQSAEIKNDTSWSCHHGVNRWAKECPCTPGTFWKKGKRETIDDLNSALYGIFRHECISLGLKDPLEVRNGYIKVILGDMTVGQYIHSLGVNLTSEQEKRLSHLLEGQKFAQYMQTSCGWFHDSLNRIEPKHNIATAAAAVYHTYLATGIDLSGMVQRSFDKIEADGLNAGRYFAEQYARAQRFLNF